MIAPAVAGIPAQHDAGALSVQAVPVLGSLIAVDWQAGVAWLAIMGLVLGGVGVLVGLAVIAIRAAFFASPDDDPGEGSP